MSKRRRTRAPTPRVFIASHLRYDLPFYHYGELRFNYEEYFRNPRQFRLVVLTGGEDISPAMYGHNTSKRCGTPNIIRDQRDLFVAYLAIKNNIPIVGICRGAQILNTLAGGTLIQDCSGHTVWHDVRTSDGRLMRVSSTHHQMMLPPPAGEILAWAEPSRGKEYFGGVNGRIKAPEQEVDVVFFPKLQALAMQYHPEYMSDSADSFNYSLELIEEKLGVRPVKSNWKDLFVSLPKLEITEESLAAEAAYTATLTKEELIKYEDAKWEESFVASRVRDSMSLLYGEEESKIGALDELELFKEMMAKASREADEKKEDKKPTQKSAAAGDAID